MVPVGVDIQEFRGSFEIKNFKATCSVRSLATAGNVVNIQSEPLFVTEGQKLCLSVCWKTKEHIGRNLPDPDRKVGVELVQGPGSNACYLHLALEIINVDPAKNHKAAITDFCKVGLGSAEFSSVGWFPTDLKPDAGLIKMADVFDPSQGWLHEGTFRVDATLTLAIDDASQASASVSNPRNDLSRDLDLLFRSGKHSDMIITVQGEQINAHSVILMARSSVFAAMLSSPMREGKERSVTIEDLDAPTVKAAIAFMYSGEIAAEALKSDDSALGILQVAHRYNIPGLVDLAIQALTAQFKVDTVAEWFHLADLIGNADFRARCLNFIRLHVSEVQYTEKFKEFISKNPALLTEILSCLFPAAKRQRIEEAAS